MSQQNELTVASVLAKLSVEKQRARFFGKTMSIIAEGFVCQVGDDVIGITHKKDGEPDEYLIKDAIIKVQKLAEYSHF